MTRQAYLGVAALIAVAPPIRAQQLHYEGAVSLTSGTYIFTERTNSWTVSTGLALTAGPVTLRGSFPLFVQNTTLLASSGSGLLPTGGASSGAVTGYQARAGDPVFGAAAALGSGRVGLLLGANAKAPLTDTTGFGTRAWDFGGSASLSYLFGLTTFVSVGATYWVMGDPPDLDLQNPLYVSASISYLGLSGWGVSGTLATATSIIDGLPNSTSLSASLLRAGRRHSIGLTVGVGLTDMAPDVVVGLTWRLQFLGRR